MSMTNFGSTIIIVSLALSLGAFICVICSFRGKKSCAFHFRLLSILSSASMLIAIIVLLYYFISSDFRFYYVYSNSSRDLSLPYRIAALWAGKEGSFLLWLFFLNIFGLIVGRGKETQSYIVSSVLLLSQMFILVILVVESPFIYVWDKFPQMFSPGLIPGDGMGLNPLLKDPWMVAHPPVLFLGYASATVPFGYAVAGLLKKNYSGWLAGAYPWLLFSMVTLGIGIFLGGYWAYSVLGWGGYWGWDPVENSSLIPWLASVALVHGFIVQRRQGSLVRTNLFLGLIYFILVWYSAWLTRSGVLSNFSVHSFAESDISMFLLSFLLLYIAAAAGLFIMRFKDISGQKLSNAFIDWRTITVYGVIVLSVYSFLILTGTSMPLLTSLFMKQPSNATELFYSIVSKPFGIMIVVFMFLATTFMLSKQNKVLTLDNALVLTVSIIFGILINLGFTFFPSAIYTYLMAILCFFLISRAILDLWHTRSMALMPSRLTHIGVGILVLGIITSNFQTSAIQKKMEKDKEYDIESLRLTFKGFKEEKQSSLQFNIRQNKNAMQIGTAYYMDQKTGSLYREPYIVAGFMNDIYIAPEQFVSGLESVSQLEMTKGQETEFTGLKIQFKEFRTEHMTSGAPATSADLIVNGIFLSPGMKFANGKIEYTEQKIPGTDRIITLQEIDANSKKIYLNISPGNSIPIPPDKVIITVTKKRLIWLVWLGTGLIAVGGCLAIVRSFRKQAS